MKRLCALVSTILLVQACSDAPTITEQTKREAATSGYQASVQQTSLLDALRCVRLLAAQTVVAGEVCIINDQSDLKVQYRAMDGWTLTTTHLAVAMSSNDLPQTTSGNPQVGKFPYSSSHPQSTTVVTHEVSLSAVGATPGGAVILAAHADVIDASGTAEGAWAEGTQFSDSNWAMHLAYTLSEDVGDAAFIGPPGGTLRGPPDGDLEGVTLEIPPGAFEEPELVLLSPATGTEIRNAVSASPIAGFSIIGPVVDIQSTRDTLLAPATLQLPLNGALLPSEAPVGDAYVVAASNQGGIPELVTVDPFEEIPTSGLDPVSSNFRVPIRHFTLYAPFITSPADLASLGVSVDLGCSAAVPATLLGLQAFIPDTAKLAKDTEGLCRSSLWRDADCVLAPRSGGLSDVNGLVIHSTASPDTRAEPEGTIQLIGGALFSGLAPTFDGGQGFQAHYYIDRHPDILAIVPDDVTLTAGGPPATLTAEGRARVYRLVNDNFIANHVKNTAIVFNNRTWPLTNASTIGIELLQHFDPVSSNTNSPPISAAQEASLRELLRVLRRNVWPTPLPIAFHKNIQENKSDPLHFGPGDIDNLGTCSSPGPPVPVGPTAEFSHSEFSFDIEWESTADPDVLTIGENSDGTIMVTPGSKAGTAELSATVTFNRDCGLPSGNNRAGCEGSQPATLMATATVRVDAESDPDDGDDRDRFVRISPSTLRTMVPLIPEAQVTVVDGGGAPVPDATLQWWIEDISGQAPVMRFESTPPSTDAHGKAIGTLRAENLGTARLSVATEAEGVLHTATAEFEVVPHLITIEPLETQAVGTLTATSIGTLILQCDYPAVLKVDPDTPEGVGFRTTGATALWDDGVPWSTSAAPQSYRFSTWAPGSVNAITLMATALRFGSTTELGFDYTQFAGPFLDQGKELLSPIRFDLRCDAP